METSNTAAAAADHFIANEAMIQIAEHYARKMVAAGLNPTPKQMADSIAYNWPKLVAEMAELAAAAKTLVLAEVA